METLSEVFPHHAYARTMRTPRGYERVRASSSSVRGRLTIVAAALLTVALALAAAIMLFVLHQSLLGYADAATSARADEVAAGIGTGGVAGLDNGVLTPSETLDVIQVVDSQGMVVASDRQHSTSALLQPAAPGVRHTADGATFPGADAEYRATSLGVRSPTGDFTVVVATAEAPINRVIVTVAVLLCIVFPLILLMLMLITYYFVDRALRPVERIRSEVAEISSSDLSRRVPVPTTGDEISTLARTMNDMLGGLEAGRLQQLRFVGDASHELRSPLTTLVGLLDLSRTTREPIDPITVDNILLPEALRLQVMIDDMLLLAKADERGVPLDIEDVDLDEIVSNEVARLEAISPLQVPVAITPVRVRGDSEKLSRALRNLADNAARHAQTFVRFEMSVDAISGTGRVTIVDDGPGIPDTDKTRVFDRFVRLEADRERSSGGSGLGLAIVAEIIRAHVGTTDIRDTPGGGTTIIVTLPLATT